jgi:hypothetical protein
MNFDHDDEDLWTDDSRARALFEAGDLGLPPGRRYPVLGSGEYSQRWRAVMGACEEEHLRGLEEKAQRDYPDRYIRKRFRRLRTLVTCPNERLIGADQFREAYSAVAFANSKGAILNTHITLTWQLLGYQEDNEASAALQAGFIKPMREWYRHQADGLGRPFAWIYAHERSKSKGFHTHFLASIPLEFQRGFRKWLGGRLKRLSQNGSASKEAAFLTDVRPDRPLLHQWRHFGYLMKSFDPRAHLPEFEGSATTVPLADLVEWPQEGPGEVNCKLRVGIARDIRAPERARAQYRSMLDCGITDVRLLFGDYDFERWQMARLEGECRQIADKRGAELMMNLKERRSRAEDDFRLEHAAWLRMVKERDKVFREFESMRASQLQTIGDLLRA